jgi:hypothetical protein
MPVRKPLSPWERKLVEAQKLGSLDVKEGVRYPKVVPQILEALGIRQKLGVSDLTILKSMYLAGYYTGE